MNNGLAHTILSVCVLPSLLHPSISIAFCTCFLLWYSSIDFCCGMKVHVHNNYQSCRHACMHALDLVLGGGGATRCMICCQTAPSTSQVHVHGGTAGPQCVCVLINSAPLPSHLQDPPTSCSMACSACKSSGQPICSVCTGWQRERIFNRL